MQESKTAIKQRKSVHQEESQKSEMQKRLDDRINKLIALHVKVLVASETTNEGNTAS